MGLLLTTGLGLAVRRRRPAALPTGRAPKK